MAEISGDVDRLLAESGEAGYADRLDSIREQFPLHDTSGPGVVSGGVSSSSGSIMLMPTGDGGLGLPAIDTLPLAEQEAYWAGVIARGENTAVIGRPQGLAVVARPSTARSAAILPDDLGGLDLGSIRMNDGIGDGVSALAPVIFGDPELGVIEVGGPGLSLEW